MSSSDNNDTISKGSSGWQPLVPTQLEKYDGDTSSLESRKDLALERQFKALYDQHQQEKDSFSLLYAKEGLEESGNEQDQEIAPDGSQQAEIIQDATNDEAEEVVPEEPDIEAIERNAWKEGYAKGEKEGYDAGLAAATEKTDQLHHILDELETFWTSLLETNEKQIIDLVAKISEKVVYGSVLTDNEIITRAILDVFEKIPNPVDATITVNPADYEYIEVVKDDFFEKIQGLKQVRIVSDQLIAPGGCRIETKAGEVDTTLEERLEAVKKSILSISGVP